MNKYYLRINNNSTEDKLYYPLVGGIIFWKYPFDRATEAQNMGMDLAKHLLDNPEIMEEWKELQMGVPISVIGVNSSMTGFQPVGVSANLT